jgi:hypothetical protein
VSALWPSAAGLFTGDRNTGQQIPDTIQPLSINPFEGLAEIYRLVKAVAAHLEKFPPW